MTRCMRLLHHIWHLTGTLLTLLVDVVHFLRLCLRPSAGLAAENLFLRKQLHFGLAGPLVQLASGVGHGAARHFYSLASPGISAFLALEVAARTTPNSS